MYQVKLPLSQFSENYMLIRTNLAIDSSIKWFYHLPTSIAVQMYQFVENGIMYEMKFSFTYSIQHLYTINCRTHTLVCTHQIEGKCLIGKTITQILCDAYRKCATSNWFQCDAIAIDSLISHT